MAKFTDFIDSTLNGFFKSIRVPAFINAAVTRGKSAHFAVIAVSSESIEFNHH